MDFLNSAQAYLGLGANIGDREAALTEAVESLQKAPGVRVNAVSSLYQTAPVGLRDQPDFLNAVVAVQTTLPPADLLASLLEIEKKLGRVRTERWGPRVIDIDILLYGDQAVAEPALQIPHPRMGERAFVLTPLAEIAPDLVIPPQGQRISELLSQAEDQNDVTLFPSASWDRLSKI